MKKFVILLTAVLLLGMLSVTAFAADPVGYVSTSAPGDDANDGLSALTPKKTLGSKAGKGVLGILKDGGTMVIPGRLMVGAKDTTYTLNLDGALTITANDGVTDYKNPSPNTNPSSGSLKMASGLVFAIASDLTLDDVILFQEAGQNTIRVKSGATLRITDKIVTLTKQAYYMNIEVEDGGTAIINGGTYSNVSGNGKIELGANVTVLENGASSTPATPAPSTPAPSTPTEQKPATVSGNYAYISTTEGNNNNDGLSPNSEKKTIGTAEGNGAFSLVANGGTVYVTEKWQMGQYTLKANGPITITGNDGTTDYKFPYPSTNPGGGTVKLVSGVTVTIESDLIFDDIIIFQEGNQGTLHVKSGATLTVTDLCVLMSAKDYHYKVVIDEGAKAILSEEAQKTFTIENNGSLETYKPEHTIVKLTIGSKLAYINNAAHDLDAAPLNRNSRTMLPVRFVAESLGATVGWDGATSTVTVTSDTAEIKIVIGATSATVNGQTVTLDSPAFIESSRTYLPVRFVAENLGATVEWVAATNTAILTK